MVFVLSCELRQHGVSRASSAAVSPSGHAGPRHAKKQDAGSQSETERKIAQRVNVHVPSSITMHFSTGHHQVSCPGQATGATNSRPCCQSLSSTWLSLVVDWTHLYVWLSFHFRVASCFVTLCHCHKAHFWWAQMHLGKEGPCAQEEACDFNAGVSGRQRHGGRSQSFRVPLVKTGRHPQGRVRVRLPCGNDAFVQMSFSFAC